MGEASKKCGEGGGPCTLAKIEGCASSSGLDYAQLSACTKNKPEALRLQHDFDKLTPSDHTYVPWVVVDGKVIKDSDKLIAQVCEKYKGVRKPAACKKFEDADASSTSAVPEHACHANW